MNDEWNWDSLMELNDKMTNSMKTIILEQPETETILAKDADVSKGIVCYDGSKFIGLVTEYGDGFCIYRYSGKSDYYSDTLLDILSKGFTFKQLS